jgi:hypothetical protein
MTDIGELRLIVEQLQRWERTAPDSLDVAQSAAEAMTQPTTELSGRSGAELVGLLTDELSEQLSQLPADVAERLRLLSAGINAISSLKGTLAQWVKITARERKK